MKKFFKYLFLFVVVIATGKSAIAGGVDSVLLRMRDHILKSIQHRIKENEERAKKGLPKNYIVFADMRELQGRGANDDSNHVITLAQKHTTQETINGIWDFAGNKQLQKLSKQLTDFSAKNGYDYYLVIAAIYNIDDDDTEKTDFSEVSWEGIEGLKDTGTIRTSTDPHALQYYTDDGANKFYNLTRMLQNKLKLPSVKSNVLYHFVITTYFPYESKAGTLGGRVAHLQSIYASTISSKDLYNDAFHNYQRGIAIRSVDKENSTKEDWLLAGVSGIQDFIAEVKNFKESDIMAINSQKNMLDFLKGLRQPTVLLSDISWITRAHIINILNSGGLRDDYQLSLFGNGGENAMLAVIKTTPPSQADSLQQLLMDNSYELLKDLNSKFDDAGIWGTGNNYTKFVQSLSMILVANVKEKKLAEVLDKGRVYKMSISENFLINAFARDINGDNDTELLSEVNLNKPFKRSYATVSVTPNDLTAYKLTSYTEVWDYQALADVNNKQVQDNTYLIKQYNNQDYDTQKSDPGTTVTLSPFDMILVIPETDFTINGFTLAKGSFQLVPLFYYYWLRQKHSNQEWLALGGASLDVLMVAGMVTGIGEMIEGGNLALQLMRGARLLFDAKILLNSNFHGKIDLWLKEKLGENGYSLYKFIEYSYIIYSVSKGGIALAKKAGSAMSNAASRLYEIMERKGLIAELQSTYPELYNAFKIFFKVLGKDLGEIEAAARLAEGFKGTLKTAYDKLIKAGLKPAGKGGTISLYHKKELVAIIRDNKLYFKYDGYGGYLEMTEDITTTVLGKWEDLLGGEGTKTFIDWENGLPEGCFTRGQDNPNGMSFLDIPNDEYQALLTKNIEKYLKEGKLKEEAIELSKRDGNEEFWETHNYPFLEAAFKRGDKIKLVANKDYYKNASEKVGGFFKREIEAIEEGYKNAPPLMEKYGYAYDPKTFTYFKK
jgi:hypothetical protein